MLEVLARHSEAGRPAATLPTLELPSPRDGLEAAWESGDTRWRRAMLGAVLERVVLSPEQGMLGVRRRLR